MNPWMRWLVTFAWTPFLCCGESPAERFHRESIAQLPGTPHALFVDGCATNLLHHGSAADATFSVVEVPDQPFGHAVRVAVKQRTSPAWKVQLISHPNAAAIKKGDVLYIGLSLRCLASKAETGGGSLFATLQQVKTYDSLGNLHASPGTNWTRVHLRTVAQQDYPAQNIELVFHLGSADQILEFGGLVAVNLGPGVDLRQLPLTRIHYSGQGDNQPWRQEALARIEAIRKGDLTIHLQRTNNTPITHATVRIRMTRHAYQFGTSSNTSSWKITPKQNAIAKRSTSFLIASPARSTGAIGVGKIPLHVSAISLLRSGPNSRVSTRADTAWSGQAGAGYPNASRH